MGTTFCLTSDVPPPAGTYRRVRQDGQLTAVVACPQCGWRGALSKHNIDSAGAVSPSVVCSTCDFHDWITLEGWNA